jgi:rubredoxin
MRMSTPAANAIEVPYRTFMCVVCGFIYNEAEGWPSDGIAPDALGGCPGDRTCPDCGVTKSDSEMVEIR